MEQQAYEIRELLEQRLLPLSRTKLYMLVGSGRIKSIRIGRKIIIPVWAIREFLGERQS